jgi:hypothetical protein
VEYIGKVLNREVFHIAVRKDSNLLNQLPVKDWLAFTIIGNNKLTEVSVWEG